MAVNSKSGTINVVVNADTNTLAAYRYHDQHVDDTQAAESFAMLRNGWHAAYVSEADEYKVSTPSGLLRTYVRVVMPA
jgi:hypothetical protein